MGEGYLVNPTALRDAETTWDDQSEVLRGSARRLSDAQDVVADLGPRVGPAATAFLTTWLTQLRDLVDAADAHAEALGANAAGYATQDQVVRDDLARLLPWGQHDGAPTPHYTSTPGYQGYQPYSSGTP